MDVRSYSLNLFKWLLSQRVNSETRMRAQLWRDLWNAKNTAVNKIE